MPCYVLQVVILFRQYGAVCAMCTWDVGVGLSRVEGS